MRSARRTPICTRLRTPRSRSRAWTNVFGQKTFLLADTSTYEWTGAGAADAHGFRDWCDTNNWRTASASPEKAGCPVNAYATAAFPTGGTVAVTVPKPIGLRKLQATAEGLDLLVRGAGSPRIDMSLFLASDNNQSLGRPVMIDVSGEGTRVALHDLAVDEANSVRISGGGTLALPLISASSGVNRSRVVLVPARRCGFLLGELSASPWNWQPAEAWQAETAPKSIGVEISPPSGSFIILM